MRLFSCFGNITDIIIHINVYVCPLFSKEMANNALKLNSILLSPIRVIKTNEKTTIFIVNIRKLGLKKN